MEIRARIASGATLSSWEEIDAEVKERRGERDENEDVAGADRPGTAS